MKFTSELVKTACSIYRKAKSKGLATKENWRTYLSEAYKQAFRFVKSCIKNAISFFKLDGTFSFRKVDFVSKYKNYNDFEKGRFFMWDLEDKKVITLHPFQLIC